MRRSHNSCFAVIFSFAIAVLAAGSSHAIPERGRVVKVIDGDTIVVDTGDGKERIRLIGIDTPEKELNEKAERDSARSSKDVDTLLAMGERSFEFVRGLLPKGAAVRLEGDVESKDKYGRTLAYVFLDDGRMLNEIIVAEGFASPYTRPPNVRYAERFTAAAQAARAKQKGLWQHGGLPMPKNGGKRGKSKDSAAHPS